MLVLNDIKLIVDTLSHITVTDLSSAVGIFINNNRHRSPGRFDSMWKDNPFACALCSDLWWGKEQPSYPHSLLALHLYALWPVRRHFQQAPFSLIEDSLLSLLIAIYTKHSSVECELDSG